MNSQMLAPETSGLGGKVLLRGEWVTDGLRWGGRVSRKVVKS